jgi:DNA-binding NarL/FixJ family response regulator
MSAPGSGPLNSVVSHCSESSTGAICVLLAGAHGDLAEALASALELRGAVLQWAKSSAELAERAARADLPAPAIVYVDLRLPDSDNDLFTQVRQSFPQAFVVALDVEVDGERATHLLGVGVPSLPLPQNPDALATLALRLSSQPMNSAPSAPPPQSAIVEGSRDFAGTIEAYVTARSLSAKQRAILRLYLAGSNDKAIAEDCGCSVATVYEHWRRMAKKVGGAQKADVVADFHRFLDAGTRRPDAKDVSPKFHDSFATGAAK